MKFFKVLSPKYGEKVIYKDFKFCIPNYPIIPYIVGDGIGTDIVPAMLKVIDFAVNKIYGSKKKIIWMEIYAGEKAIQIYGMHQWLPKETLEILKNFHISIKGPLTTPIGGGIRSINVKIRQDLDLYVCLRPIRYFKNVPSPLKQPWKTNVVVFRENSEDIYTGIEWKSNSIESKRVVNFIKNEMNINNIKFEDNCGIGIKIISEVASKRLVKAAIDYAINNNRNSITLVHKGNIMKFTEGAFKNWGYSVAQEIFQAKLSTDGKYMELINPNNNNTIIVNDILADAFLQQILLKPEDYDIIATTNLNGDYISDAISAQVGGLGMAPGANIGNDCVVFEATHGTAPKYSGLNQANPSSMILSGEMMLRYMGWIEAANLVITGIQKTINSKIVTYDLFRSMKDAKCVGTIEFANEIIRNMNEM